jgi:hypothetical protein
MPNWCNNTITISGPKDKITKLYNDAKAENGLLQAMVPMPKELEDTTSPAPKEGTPQPLVDGFDNWYDWRVQNWGCKWDVDMDGLELSEDGTNISGWFDSPWGPPIEAYSTYLDKNEDCSVESHYEEGGMDFAGHWHDGQDDFIENISDYARQVVKGNDSGSTLYDYLDDQLELTENRREYIEEELNEDAQKVHDFVVEGKAVNGKMETA